MEASLGCCLISVILFYFFSPSLCFFFYRDFEREPRTYTSCPNAEGLPALLLERFRRQRATHTWNEQELRKSAPQLSPSDPWQSTVPARNHDLCFSPWAKPQALVTSAKSQRIPSVSSCRYYDIVSDLEVLMQIGAIMVLLKPPVSPHRCDIVEFGMRRHSGGSKPSGHTP